MTPSDTPFSLPIAVEPAAPVVCAHTGWAALRVAGPDAVAFLHGQLSSDVNSLRTGEGQYWSYNSPKGRMLANGALWRSSVGEADAGIVMLLAADVAETIRRRLSMFVLRSNVTIDDITGSRALIGLAGNGSAGAAREAFGIAPTPFFTVTFDAGATAFMLPDRRIVIVAPNADAPVLQVALARHASTVEADVWRWFGVAAGVPWIGAATADRFVPQMANWDVLGGVNFQKGCYPGQEIVARMQYLGKLKERLFAFHANAPEAAPATPVYSAAFGSAQACGSVVNAAPDPAGGLALLVVAQVAAVDADDLSLGQPGGARLARRALPYDVPLAAPRPLRPTIG